MPSLVHGSYSVPNFREGVFAAHAGVRAQVTKHEIGLDLMLSALVGRRRTCSRSRGATLRRERSVGSRCAPRCWLACRWMRRSPSMWPASGASTASCSVARISSSYACTRSQTFVEALYMHQERYISAHIQQACRHLLRHWVYKTTESKSKEMPCYELWVKPCLPIIVRRIRYILREF